jgi:hypothetical protein
MGDGAWQGPYPARLFKRGVGSKGTIVSAGQR